MYTGKDVTLSNACLQDASLGRKLEKCAAKIREPQKERLKGIKEFPVYLYRNVRINFSGYFFYKLLILLCERELQI